MVKKYVGHDGDQKAHRSLILEEPGGEAGKRPSKKNVH